MKILGGFCILNVGLKGSKGCRRSRRISASGLVLLRKRGGVLKFCSFCAMKLLNYERIFGWIELLR